jgi:putative Mg2+ transporter-C (MgtC) family protein
MKGRERGAAGMSGWGAIGEVLRGEFSDLPGVGEAARVLLRLVFAALLGGLLGWERARAGKAAGLRTHMLVCVGAALFMMVPQQAGWRSADLSRVLQGLVAGIGFLGAGAILKMSEKREIRGLTTAAGIWLTAAVGMAVGLGREATAVAAAVLAFLILSVLGYFEKRHVQPRPDQPDKVKGSHTVPPERDEASRSVRV